MLKMRANNEILRNHDFSKEKKVSNMTIIKHGNKWAEKEIECSKCGCIFRINRGEIQEKILLSTIKTFKDGFIIVCPECIQGIYVKTKKNEV